MAREPYTCATLDQRGADAAALYGEYMSIPCSSSGDQDCIVSVFGLVLRTPTCISCWVRFLSGIGPPRVSASRYSVALLDLCPSAAVTASTALCKDERHTLHAPSYLMQVLLSGNLGTPKLQHGQSCRRSLDTGADLAEQHSKGRGSSTSGREASCMRQM
jgi:hypothetical protein